MPVKCPACNGRFMPFINMPLSFNCIKKKRNLGFYTHTPVKFLLNSGPAFTCENPSDS